MKKVFLELFHLYMMSVWGPLTLLVWNAWSCWHVVTAGLSDTCLAIAVFGLVIAIYYFYEHSKYRRRHREFDKTLEAAFIIARPKLMELFEREIADKHLGDEIPEHVHLEAQRIINEAVWECRNRSRESNPDKP